MKVLLLLFFVLFQCEASDFQLKSIEIDGVVREYALKFPQDYQKGEKIPLLIALHGGGSTWRKFNKGTTKNTLEQQCNERGFLYILPTGKDHHWNDGRKNKLENPYDDIGFISQLIDYSIAHHSADPNRIYIAGMSNGGFMAIRLAQDLSQKITAIAVVAAQMSHDIKNRVQKNPVSVILINGTSDPIVPYQGGEMKLFKFSKSKGQLLSTNQTMSYFLKSNQCQHDYNQQIINNRKFDKTSIEIRQYNNCQNNSKVHRYKVNKGGHLWPGGKQYLPIKLIGRLTREFQASKVILDFFQN